MTTTNQPHPPPEPNFVELSWLKFRAETLDLMMNEFPTPPPPSLMVLFESIFTAGLIHSVDIPPRKIMKDALAHAATLRTKLLQ